MKLVDLSIRRPVAITMGFLALVVFGIVSFSRLQLDLLPDVAFPTLTIRTEYAGVGPREMETLVSRPIEEAVSIVQGVQQVTSRSLAGRSDVTLSFRWGTDMDFAAMDLRERLDLLNLPNAATRPTIARYDPNSEPVIRVALTSARPLDERIAADRQELIDLRYLAEEYVRRGIEGIEGVAGIRITGGLVEEIQVDVDEARLATLGIPFAQVAQRLAAENINLAGGILEEGGAQYAVRTVNEFASVEEIPNIVVGTLNGQPVLLRDVAAVTQGAAERETISRVNGLEAVEIAVLRESTANIVEVAEAVQGRLEPLAQGLPDGTGLTVLRDESRFIRNAVDDVRSAALIGGVLAILVLLLFLRHLRTTLIVAVAIPISVIATFVLMFGQGITLNIMSLGGLALGIGMLVDSAIVVLESIARRREAGDGPIEAARSGTNRVAGAVTAATLTTVAVFVPIIFVQGVAGQLFGDQAWTVSFALLASLLVSLTLVPMLAARGGEDDEPLLAGGDASPAPSGDPLAEGVAPAERPASSPPRPGILSRVIGAGVRGGHLILAGIARLLRPVANLFERGFGWIDRRYPIWLRSALRRPARVGIALVAVLLFGAALLPRVGVELIPEFQQGELIVQLEAAAGTSLERMEELSERAEQIALGIDGVREVYTTVGMRGSGTLGGSDDPERHASTVLVRLDDLAVDDARVASALSERLSAIPGVAFRIDRPRLFTVSAPIEVEVRGYELATLAQIAEQVRARLRTLPEVAGVSDERRDGNPEITIRFDREQVARAGLTIAEAGESVRMRVQGAAATDLTQRDRDIAILVRAQEQQRQTLQDLGNLRIETPQGGNVALASLARLQFDEGPAEVVRRNGLRVAIIEARAAGRDLAGTISRIEDEVRQMNIPPEFSVAVAGQSQELRSSIRSMQLALLLAVFLVYLVMASQFESFRQPFIILVSVPLALVGAVLSLWVTGTPVSVVALIGVVMLSGIVVNNAIVFVDATNQLRRDDGHTLDNALIEAGRLRLRPIMMSTITTVLGLLPMALIRGEGAELRAPLAIPLIGGLILSTLLTLIVVPVLYRAVESLSLRLAAAREAPLRSAMVEPQPASGD